MKSYIKFLALALITAFAVFSCAPDASVTGYDWKDSNARHSPENGQGFDFLPQILTASVPLSPVRPRITIRFPGEADVLRESNIETSLKSFLSFHEFERNIGVGVADTLKTEISYSTVRVSGQGKNDIVVELNATFSGSYSNIIAKFKGEVYTYAKGIKMDVDRNGIGGEAVYDDLYIEQRLSGATVTNFTEPGNYNWFCQFQNLQTAIDAIISSTPGFWGAEGKNDVSTQISSMTAVEFNLYGIGTSSEERRAVYKEVINQFKDGFLLEKNKGSGWEKVTEAVYDDAIAADELLFKNFTIESGVLYRTKWTGTANLETAKPYFGVKQRFSVYSINFTPGNGEPREYYKQTEVDTVPVHFFNSNINVITTPPNVTIHSRNASRNNVVLRFEFDILGTTGTTGTDPYAGLNPLGVASFNGNNGAFEVIVGGNANNFMHDTNLKTVKVENVVYKAEGNLPGGAGKNTSLNNVIYITLDPSFRMDDATFSNMGYLINDKFAYTSTSPKRVFGNLNNYLYNNYRLYRKAVPVEVVPMIEGNPYYRGLNDTIREVKFTFNAEAGRTYFANVNSTYGNFDYTLDYNGTTTVENNPNTVISFYAVSSGAVGITVKTGGANTTISINYTSVDYPLLTLTDGTPALFTKGDINEASFIFQYEANTTYYFWARAKGDNSLTYDGTINYYMEVDSNSYNGVLEEATAFSFITGNTNGVCIFTFWSSDNPGNDDIEDTDTLELLYDTTETGFPVAP